MTQIILIPKKKSQKENGTTHKKPNTREKLMWKPLFGGKMKKRMCAKKEQYQTQEIYFRKEKEKKKAKRRKTDP